MTADVILISHGFQKHYERGFTNGLAINGLRVFLISSDETDVKKLLPQVDAVNLRGSQRPDRTFLKKVWNLLRYHANLGLFVARRSGAIVHVIGMFGFPVLEGIVGGGLLALASERFILTVHDVLPHDRETRWNRFVYRFIYRLPHRIVVHTETMKYQLVREFSVAPARVVVMQHGIESSPVTGHDADRAVTLPPLDADRTRLLFFGVVAPYKGLDMLIESMALVENSVQLVIAGKCMDASYVAKIKHLMRGQATKHDIIWRNAFIPESEIRAYFEWADAAVLPYRHIDQSGVLFTAMQHGTPILATRVGELDRHITPDVGMISDSISCDGLAAVLTNFQAKRRNFSRQHIREKAMRLAWEETVKAILPIYDLDT